MDSNEQLHSISHPGCTGRLNAPSNQNPEFQSGFKAGSDLGVAGKVRRFDLDCLMEDEWVRRGSVIDDPNFKEWKRGCHEGRLQSTPAN